MNNNKGFTLIELLAVIIILAIIALITTPIILNVVNKARQDAAKDKAWGTIEAFRVAYAQDQADNETLIAFPYESKFMKDATTGKWSAKVGETSIKMSGEVPQGGTITMDEDGLITCDGLMFGAYSCTTEDGNTMTCDDGGNGTHGDK